MKKMKIQELKEKRAKELAKLIFVDLNVLLRNRQKPLTVNGFFEKKAHDYQLGGYDFNPTKKEITDIYEKETNRRGIVFWNKIREEKEVNGYLNDIGLKKGDILCKTHSSNGVPYGFVSHGKVSGVKINDEKNKIFMLFEVYDRFPDTPGKNYVDMEYSLSSMEVNNGKLIHYEDKSNKKATITTFKKEISAIEKIPLGKDQSNYVIKDYIKDFGDIFISGVKIGREFLSDFKLIEIGTNKYFSVSDSERSFCIDKDNNLVEIKDACNLLFSPGRKGVSSDSMYLSSGLLNKWGGEYNGELFLSTGFYPSDSSVHIFKNGKRVYSANSEKISAFVVNSSENLILERTKEKKYDFFGDYKLIKINEDNSQSVLFELKKHKDISFFHVDVKNDLIFISTEYNTDNLMVLKLSTGEALIQQLNGVPSKNNTSVFNGNNIGTIFSYGNYGEYQVSNLSPSKSLFKYEVKKGKILFELSKKDFTNEKINRFSITKNGKCYGEKARSEKEFCLEKIFK